MATNGIGNWQHTMAQKSDINQTEDVETEGRSNSIDKNSPNKHGDRALAIIGDERVFLTEDDVRFALWTSCGIAASKTVADDGLVVRTSAFDARLTKSSLSSSFGPISFRYDCSLMS